MIDRLNAAHHLPPRATSPRESQAPLAAVRWMRMLDLKFDLSCGWPSWRCGSSLRSGDYPARQRLEQ
jgi:hypothetical protein